MSNRKPKSNKGFIALMSVIIISAITMALAFTTNVSTFYSRFDALDAEYKRIAEGLAESCVDQALLKLAQSYQYDPVTDPAYIATKGVPVTVDSGTCYIKSITPGATRTGNSTLVTISTQGVYKNTFSDFKATATLQNPASASYTPPPSCYLWSNTASVYAGQQATLGWITSNAVSLKITAVTNTALNINSASIPSGSQAITLNQPESFYGTATNASGVTATCTTPSGYIAPSISIKPAASCADTVMIFDRSGSMSSTDLANEKSAGTKLLSLYQGAVPAGNVSIGSFGGLDGSDASIPSGGVLSQNWSGLTSILNSITGSNSSVGSNLSLAIDVAAAELNGPRHDTTSIPPKDKVLIFVSDGEPNEPSTITGNDVLGPNKVNVNSQNATGDSWSNASGAYDDGGSVATDIGGHRHRYYYNTSFGTFKSGSTINGIQIFADAWTTLPAKVTKDTGYVSPSSQSSDTGGDGNGFENNPTGAYSDVGSVALNANGVGDRHRYYGYNFNIPSGSKILGIQVRTDWWTESTNGTNSISIELSSDGGATWTSPQNESTEGTSDTNNKTIGNGTYLWGRSWTDTNLGSNFRLRITSNCTGSTTCSSRDFSLDWIPVKVYYEAAPTSSSCQLGVDLSWDGGNNWTTTEQKTNLTNSEAQYILGSPTNVNSLWSGHSWSSADFANNKFRIRVHNIDPDPGSDNTCPDLSTANLDWLQAKVYYSYSQSLTQTEINNLTITSANNAKNSGIQIFTVRYSSDTNSTAIALLRDSIASSPAYYFPSPLDNASITNIFDTIGQQVCPAAVAPGIPPSPPSPPPPPPPPNITIGSWIETATSN